MFVSLQTRDGLAFSIDVAGVVKTWDFLTGCCKKTYETQIETEGVEHADIQLIGDRLIIVWKKVTEQQINVWDVEKGELQTIHPSKEYTYGLRIVEDGSRVLHLNESSIQAWDIWTGVCVYEEMLNRDDGRFDTLRMDGSKVLVCFGESSVQGWDFGTPGSAPIQFSEPSSSRFHLDPIDVRKMSKDNPVRIEDSVTGQEVFQLYGKYEHASATQWDGQYLIVGYVSGEVLVLDLSHVFTE
jgi:WD40 repeat protein